MVVTRPEEQPVNREVGRQEGGPSTERQTPAQNTRHKVVLLKARQAKIVYRSKNSHQPLGDEGLESWESYYKFFEGAPHVPQQVTTTLPMIMTTTTTHNNDNKDNGPETTPSQTQTPTAP